jgi:citrate lyase beta subunit
MHLSLSESATRSILTPLEAALGSFAAARPGERTARQPVHTVYGGADLFTAGLARKLGDLARRALDAYAPDSATFAAALDLTDADLAETVYRRVIEKLAREPVEDFRIDFEDGYGHRPDEEEDACAQTAAREVAAGIEQETLPPFIGIRIKPLTAELATRGARTLDLFLTTLAEETGGRLPSGFVVTLPKVLIPEQVSALVDLLEALEERTAIPAGLLRLELMVETPQSILAPDGTSALPHLMAAARGRCVAAHFGVYDYTASLHLIAAEQVLDHPVCDFARHMMQIGLTGTGIWLCDGATNVIPAPPHRPAGKDQPLTDDQVRENRAAVHQAWRLHYDHVRHSLSRGYYQGWDLNPAQFPTRYAALYAFFLEGLATATERLRHFVEEAAKATLSGDVFDDAATGQALFNFFLRGLNCGAITREEALQTGLTLEELRGRSFVKILARRG